MTGNAQRVDPQPANACGEDRFRAIHRRLHADHLSCLDDEWLTKPCRDATGRLLDRPLIWSRRNGPWRRVPVLWVGAAPGNAGGKGRGDLGAHGTRIPFGGDIAGANLEVLLGAIGLDRNRTFITAALNQLPARGGGEPTLAELRRPAGAFPSSIHLLRETILAAGPSLIVALGNIALRCIAAAAGPPVHADRLPSLDRLRRLGAERGDLAPLANLAERDDAFRDTWSAAWQDAPLADVLWLVHPSGQNMSPFAAKNTLFHKRMIEARDALRAVARNRPGCTIVAERPELPDDGIYALAEWRERIAPRHARLDALWRAHGV
ncbi:MAG: uracil-DNA glycosylase family protein [Longimicrobiales bacterium]